MTTSDQINEIAAALAKAQGVMKNAPLNKTNPHFKSRFADLASVRDTVIPALTANGIAVAQVLDADSVGIYVLTRLLHVSGQWIESQCPIPNGQDMQKMGSAITYARRYSLSAICGIAADEDDDGNEAAKQVNGKAEAAPKPSGYEDWITDLESAADDGLPAVSKAFKASKVEYRSYLTMHDKARHDAIKAKAEKQAVTA